MFLVDKGTLCPVCKNPETVIDSQNCSFTLTKDKWIESSKRSWFWYYFPVGNKGCGNHIYSGSEIWRTISIIQMDPSHANEMIVSVLWLWSKDAKNTNGLKRSTGNWVAVGACTMNGKEKVESGLIRDSYYSRWQREPHAIKTTSHSCRLSFITRISNW